MKQIINIAAMIFAFCFTAFAQANDPDCPTISVTGPSSVPVPGESISYSADISNEVEKYNVEYFWSISSGKIVLGQGSKNLVVVEEQGKNLTVTLEVKGLPDKCPNTASETALVASEPLTAVKTDEFSFGRSGTKARLDEFFIELMNDPSSEGVIVFYDDKDLMRNVKSVLNHINFRKFDKTRLTLKISEKDDGMTVFFRVPAGADLPDRDTGLFIKLEDFEKLQKLFQPKIVKPKTKR